jgi:hypothetical protein
MIGASMKAPIAMPVMLTSVKAFNPWLETFEAQLASPQAGSLIPRPCCSCIDPFQLRVRSG